jgi:hypothetical protein
VNDYELRQIPLAALFTALGIIFPQFFHLLGLGAGFLPMFLPLMLGSMFLSWQYVIIMGVACPGISWLLTSMPPIAPPILPVLTIELVLTGLVITLLRHYSSMPVVVILLIAIIIDRLALMIMIALIAPMLDITHPIFTVGLVLAGIPGIILQLVVIPYAVLLIEKRYPHWRPDWGTR